MDPERKAMQKRGIGDKCGCICCGKQPRTFFRPNLIQQPSPKPNILWPNQVQQPWGAKFITPNLLLRNQV